MPDIPILTPVADPALAAADYLYSVEEFAAPLYACAFPQDDFPWATLAAAGVQHVVCLCGNQPRYDPAPLSLLAAVDLDDLVDRNFPEHPELERATIGQIVGQVIGSLAAREGILVHCAGGRGRTGTLIGSMLVRSGCDPEETIRALDDLYKGFMKPGWPESKWQADVVRSGAAQS